MRRTTPQKLFKTALVLIFLRILIFATVLGLLVYGFNQFANKVEKEDTSFMKELGKGVKELTNDFKEGYNSDTLEIKKQNN